jgi:flagellar hook-associated protein 1 FlgK
MELNQELEREVQDANRIISSIADLNEKVYEGGIGSGETNDFLDQRAVLFKELSGKLDLVSIQDSYGRLTVLTAKGKVLVDGGRSWNLGTVQDEATGFKRVAWVDAAGNASDISGDIEGGKLKALMDMRDGELRNVFIKNMDDLAESVIKEVNAVHKGGVNLNGTTDIPFFEEIDTGYAKGIALSSSIKRDVKNIASTSSSVNSTDNDIAMGIASLGETNVTVGGSQTTFTNYVSSLMTNIGQMAANAKDRSQYDQDTMEVMEKQRESLSGVSLDEEMADLIKFQYAYQAAARLFTVADELFKTLLQAV